MSKFKVGDKVRVLPRLEGQRKQKPCYVEDMTEYVGEEFVIREINAISGILVVNGLWFNWHEDWLELVDKPCTVREKENN